MRRAPLIPHEYYHLYNRGIARQNIFLDDDDRLRFLFLILYLQSPIIFPQINRMVSTYKKEGNFHVDSTVSKTILKSRYLNLISFVLMPNHFHLIVLERKISGTSHFMQRVLNSYTKYFNQKYQQRGHLFQGPFQAIRISDEKSLIDLSAHVHRNPRDLPGWKGKERDYPWSSFSDCIEKNRWGEFLENGIILKKFSSGKEYRKFVETFSGKRTHSPLPPEHLIDEVVTSFI